MTRVRWEKDQLTGREYRSLCRPGKGEAAFSYPTCAVFSADGRYVFFESDRYPDFGPLAVLRADLRNDTVEPILNLCEDVGAEPVRCGFHTDYAQAAEKMLYQTPDGRRLKLLDLTTGKVTTIWEDENFTMGQPVSVFPDATRAAVWGWYPGPGENRFFTGQTYVIFSIDIDPDSGERAGLPRPVVIYPGRKHPTPGCPSHEFYPVLVNHCQVNPVHKDIIGFAHEFGGLNWEDGSLELARVWAVRADGEDCHPLVREVPGEWFTHEVWGPRGEWHYFNETGHISRVDLAGRRERIFERGELICAHLTVEPKEQWLVSDGWDQVSRTPAGHACTQVFLVEISTGRGVLVARPTGAGHPGQPHPQFSPDGRTIAYNYCDEDLNVHVAVMDVADIVGA